MAHKLIKPKKRVVVNPLTGQFEYVTDNNFSYESVPEHAKLVIHENNQMIVYEGFSVDGDLDLHGSLILEE